MYIYIYIYIYICCQQPLSSGAAPVCLLVETRAGRVGLRSTDGLFIVAINDSYQE